MTQHTLGPYRCRLCLVGLSLLLTGAAAYAEDFPAGTGSSFSEDAEKGLFSSKSEGTVGLRDTDRQALDVDRLKIGGSLRLEWWQMTLERAAQSDFTMNPMTLEIYLESQLKDDARVFASGRLIHDGSVNEAVASPITTRIEKQTTGQLDEMKLQVNSYRKVFWTLGKQKIKWGAGKFWNPTDFLNLQRRDFLRQEDLRSGVTMAKAHVPLNDSNLYLIGVNESATEAAQTGFASRFEIPWSFGEWTASMYSRKDAGTRLGTDVSVAVGAIDVFAEYAQTDRSAERAASAGASYEFKYSDDDMATLALEGFWQEIGAERTSQYAALVASGRWVPFHVAKSYLSLMFMLPKPGSWNESTFIAYAMQNLVDSSQYYRLTWTYTGFSDIQWALAGGARVGGPGSEMKYFGQALDWMLQAKARF